MVGFRKNEENHGKIMALYLLHSLYSKTHHSIVYHQ